SCRPSQCSEAAGCGPCRAVTWSILIRRLTIDRFRAAVRAADPFPISKWSRIMRGRKSHKRFAILGVAIVLFAGMGVAIFLPAGRSRFPSSPPRTFPTGNQRAAKSIAADLVTAIRNGDVRVVRKLLDNGADVNARDAEGNTPLILASFYASPECLELLIEKGADVNSANKAGATPLIRAATDYEKTRLLVSAGANIRVRTALGNTPLLL